MTLTSRGLKLLAIATFTAASSMSLVGTATASPQPQANGSATAAQSSAPDCRYESFCAYGSYGNQILGTDSDADWSSGGGVDGVHSYYNNGKPQPGYDHVGVTYEYVGFDGKTREGYKCIHYGDPDGIGDFGYEAPVTIMKVTWRGEC